MEIEIMNHPETSPQVATPERCRPLKSHELVTLGDFILNENKELELWEGPSGFRADAFIKPIYRKDADERRSPATRK